MTGPWRYASLPQRHKAAKRRLHQEWPTLARALEALAATERP